MDKLIPGIIAWAYEKNILHGSNLEKETLKLIEKCSKLRDFLNDESICAKYIGHCIVQLIIICKM